MLPSCVGFCHTNDILAECFGAGEIVFVIFAGQTIRKAFGVLEEYAECEGSALEV